MVGAYIAIVLGVVVWALMVPLGKKLPDSAMRAVTVFGGAFLLAVCCMELLPEAAESYLTYAGRRLYPFVAILVGFLIQQILDGLSAHAEHGHTEEGYTIAGLMIGLCVHAFLEGTPLVWEGRVSQGLLWGIVIHNIPVALILVGLMTARGYGFWRILALLALFGVMSPLGALTSQYLVKPDFEWQCIITGLVVGVLLHVSSSILFDHKQGRFSWANILTVAVAFAMAALIIV